MASLAILWAVIIIFGVFMYVILDGFTLGTGILLPFSKGHERDIILSAVLPTWDGNQTWLVLGGAALYGAFPTAFSTIFPVLYLPLLIMVIALLFRGVSFEFRLKAKAENRIIWDRAFFLSSLLVALIQGLVLGVLVQGFEKVSGSPLLAPSQGLFNAYTIFTAISVTLGYALLGSTRLVLKTTNGIQAKMFRASELLFVCIVIAMIVVSIWTPFVHPALKTFWLEHPQTRYLLTLPGISLFCIIGFVVAIYKRNDRWPYWLTVILFLTNYLGFGINLWPYIVPYKITIFEAASPNDTLIFLTIGAIIFLPALLIYTGFVYNIFRGKVKDVIGY